MGLRGQANMAESNVSSSFVVSNSDSGNSSKCLRMQRNAVEWELLLLSSFASPGAEEQRQGNPGDTANMKCLFYIVQAKGKRGRSVFASPGLDMKCSLKCL